MDNFSTKWSMQSLGRYIKYNRGMEEEVANGCVLYQKAFRRTKSILGRSMSFA